MTYDVSFIPERPEERELAGALDRFALACIASSGDVGAPYLDNLYTLDEAGREVAVAVTALLARAGQTDTPPWAGLIRKRFEQVR